MVDGSEDFTEFSARSRDYWQQLLDSLNEIQAAGWYVGSTLGFGYAISPEDSDLEAASETVARTIGAGTPIEIRNDTLPCGGCFAGESPPVPNPMPGWLVAGQVSKAVRVHKAELLADKLVELGSKGTLGAATVSSIVRKGNWTSPGYIEEFAGLGHVELIPEDWLKWVGRVDARAGKANAGSTVGNFRSPIDLIGGLAQVWLNGAREERDVLPEQFDDLADRAAEREAEDAALKVPVSQEQAIANLGAMLKKADLSTEALPEEPS